MTIPIRWSRTAAGLVLALASFVWTNVMATTTAQSPAPKRVALVGASIGKDWDFDRIGERLHLSGYQFQYLGRNDFDKGPLIDQLLGGRTKPDMVLIKECASYFPGDTDKYQAHVERWVQRLRAAGVQPMLVTVAPVAAPGWVQQAKNLAKKALGKPVWPEEVAAFNDWLRAYAARERLPLFDLEAVLRVSPERRYLKQEYASGDYVHITQAAYAHMDREFARFWSVSVHDR